jgi:hypothetical protein
MRPLLQEITFSLVAVMLLGADPAVLQADERPDRYAYIRRVKYRTAGADDE